MKNKTTMSLVAILLLLAFMAIIFTAIHKKVRVKKPPKIAGRIAIVIDDWGYSLENLSIIEQIKQPLTCAVLPGLKNSNLLMQKLNNLDFEIILHLPMQPKEKWGAAPNLENNTITLNLDAAQIHNIFLYLLCKKNFDLNIK